MSAPIKLTKEQIQSARDIVEKRREAIGRVKVFPTIAKLAAELNCTPRYLQKILARKVRSE